MEKKIRNKSKHHSFVGQYYENDCICAHGITLIYCLETSIGHSLLIGYILQSIEREKKNRIASHSSCTTIMESIANQDKVNNSLQSQLNV